MNQDTLHRLREAARAIRDVETTFVALTSAFARVVANEGDVPLDMDQEEEVQNFLLALSATDEITQEHVDDLVSRLKGVRS